MSFAASLDQRLMAPDQKRPRDHLFMALLAVCFALHAGAIFLLLDRDRASPAEPEPEAIPVELVQEPPPEPPAPPEQAEQQQEQQPQPQPPPTLDEKHADDAPRARSEDKAEQDAPNDKPKSEKPPPAQSAAATPAEAPAAQPPPAPPVLATNRPDAEMTLPELRRDPAPDTPAQAPAPDAAQAKRKAFADLLAAVQRAPAWEIASAVKASPVGGGQANTTYLSILFGLVKQNMHMPTGPRETRGTASGEIVFLVDRSGKVMDARVLRPSGEKSLDLAALTAIRSSSPFPPTPTGTPVSLIYSYSAN